MPCNCTKKAKDLVYVHTTPGGQATIYGTEVEARAAQIRAGGGSVRSQAK